MKRNRRGLGLVASMLAIIALCIAASFVGPQVAEAGIDRLEPTFRVPHQIPVRLATAPYYVIDSTNVMLVATDTDTATRGFTLENSVETGREREISVYVSVSALSGGTHNVYLQGSTDGTNYGTITVSSPLTGTSTQAIHTKITLTGTGDKLYKLSGFPAAKSYRFLVDPDSSHSITFDKIEVSYE